jgi:hypothetical protein
MLFEILALACTGLFTGAAAYTPSSSIPRAFPSELRRRSMSFVRATGVEA